MLCSLIMHSVDFLIMPAGPILDDRYVHNCALSLCNAQLSVHYAVIIHSWEMIEDIYNAQ